MFMHSSKRAQIKSYRGQWLYSTFGRDRQIGRSSQRQKLQQRCCAVHCSVEIAGHDHETVNQIRYLHAADEILVAHAYNIPREIWRIADLLRSSRLSTPDISSTAAARFIHSCAERSFGVLADSQANLRKKLRHCIHRELCCCWFTSYLSQWHNQYGTNGTIDPQSFLCYFSMQHAVFERG